MLTPLLGLQLIINVVVILLMIDDRRDSCKVEPCTLIHTALSISGVKYTPVSFSSLTSIKGSMIVRIVNYPHDY